jgi:hypothetical protein
MQVLPGPIGLAVCWLAVLNLSNEIHVIQYSPFIHVHVDFGLDGLPGLNYSQPVVYTKELQRVGHRLQYPSYAYILGKARVLAWGHDERHLNSSLVGNNLSYAPKGISTFSLGLSQSVQIKRQIQGKKANSGSMNRQTACED